MKNSFPLKRIFVLVLAAFFALSYASADYIRLTVPDSTEVRRTVLDSWIRAPLSQLNGRPSEIYSDSQENLFQVRAEREGQSTVVVVTPSTLLKVTHMVGNTVVDVVDEPSFNRSSCGAWLLYRNRFTGEAEKIVIYFTDSPEVYLQIRPDGKKTVVDMMVYGSYLSRGVPITIPFSNLYTTTFQTLFNLTKKSLPWGYVVPDKNQYANISALIPEIRSRTQKVTYVEDAAYNEKGVLYSITTGEPFDREIEDEALNYWLKNPPEDDNGEKPITVGAPGFAKWFVDGLVRPITGKCTKISELVVSTVKGGGISKRDVMGQEWNFTLNLDWDRHLAEKVFSIHAGNRFFSWDKCGVDVTDNFFVSTLSEDGRVLPAVGYIKNVGYGTDTLKSLLYVLAVTEPDTIFLGAIQQPSPVKADEMVFNSTAIFLPYFRSNGRFDCVVFQSGKELTLEQFVKNSPHVHVHLERIKSSPDFDPIN
ncbi:MAG: hypothetical protein IKP60_01245 [Treponema sp.]|nr:hypothetical protein [Treponema sp.]